MKSCSLQDIARACGVSTMTACRAFRESSVISSETRERILLKAEEMGYLRNKKSGRPISEANVGPRQVQLIFGNSANQMYYFHMRLLTALEQQLAQLGYECLIRTCNGRYPIFVRLLDRVRNDQSTGTIILGSFVQEQLEELLDAVPGAILIDNRAPNTLLRKFSALSFDNRAAATMAVEHLLSRGRRRILLVCGKEEHFFSQELLHGYKDALENAGVPFDARLVRHTDFSPSLAAEAVRMCRNEGVDFDAVFTNDEMATGVYRSLYEMHLRIPEDIAVCGCDDIPIGAQLYPSLTTISLNYHDLASYAIQHLVSDKQNAIFPDIRLPVTLSVRCST